MKFSDRLKEIRKKSQITQVELAKRCNVSQGTIANWESGIRTPDIDTISIIASILGVSTDYLLGVEQKESPSPVEDEREAYRAMLSDLTDEELIEMKKFTSYLRWKRNHPQGESDK